MDRYKCQASGCYHSKIVSTEGANIIDPNAGMFGSSGEDTDTDAEPVPLNFYDPETKEVTKSYTKQYVLDPEKPL